MVSLLQFGGVEWVSCRGWPEASFSQGDTWKRLISKYIQAMPSSGSMSEAEEQVAIRGASVAVIHAISAKVGDAARVSQSAAPRASQALVLPLFAAEDVVIFRFPTIVAVPGRCRVECGYKARREPGESHKCDGISMDSLITAAARALAAGDPLAALN